MTITICIGNSDDKLTQVKWSNFVADTEFRIEKYTSQIHFFGTSYGDSIRQNATWVVECNAPYADRLKAELIAIAKKYKQDSIAWITGTTEFIGQEV